MLGLLELFHSSVRTSWTLHLLELLGLLHLLGHLGLYICQDFLAPPAPSLRQYSHTTPCEFGWFGPIVLQLSALALSPSVLLFEGDVAVARKRISYAWVRNIQLYGLDIC